MKHLLILSDGRLGHMNQSIAFAKTMEYTYDIHEVKFKNKLYKALSYLFDRFGIYTKSLFDMNAIKKYDMVIGTGSNTYYPTKVMAQKWGIKSVVMMLPKGYRLHFDMIFAQSHDNPPKQKNIIEMPANFSYVSPQGVYKPKKKAIAIVIGGNNQICKIELKVLKKQLDFIKENYKKYEIAVSTSPRTSSGVEALVQTYDFDYEVIFSQNPINPIPDFLEQCETVFITADSTSMISESISYGKCNVVILPLKCKKESNNSNKFTLFIQTLQKEGYLHIFDGSIQNKNKKIDFLQYAKKAKL
ncbi:MAG: mitochondrial fission ELM1 family protein [Sulfurovum sp.]|nr:mitochondrial fission ELM1 family protein [Sulfurovum sp.]